MAAAAVREISSRTTFMGIEWLNWPIRALFAVSGVIFVATLAMWLWQGLASS